MKRYLVGLTDLREDYKALLVNLLKESGNYIRQVETNRQSKDVTEELIHLLAQLEVYFFICSVLTFPETHTPLADQASHLLVHHNPPHFGTFAWVFCKLGTISQL